MKEIKKRLERLSVEEIDVGDDLTLATLTEAEMGEVDLPALVMASEQMKAELDANRPNLGALQEYRARQKVYLERQKEYNAINDARNVKREVRNDLMKRRHSGQCAFICSTDRKIKTNIKIRNNRLIYVIYNIIYK